MPNRGFAVSYITLRDIQEIFEARLLYETMLFPLAVKNITDEELRQLEQVISQNFSFSYPALAEGGLRANTSSI